MPRTAATGPAGARLNTTDNTQTAIITIPTDTDTVVHVTAKITGVRTDTFAAAVAYLIQGVGLNDGGSLAIVGSVQAVTTAIESAALSAASVTMDASGTGIRVLVTGVTAINMTWAVEADIQAVGLWPA